MKSIHDLDHTTPKHQLLAEIKVRESNVDLHSHRMNKPCTCDFCGRMRREIQSLHRMLGDYSTLYDLAERVGEALVNYGRW